MLQKLFIQNYAIIEEVMIAFHPQLNIITGETGAGKSILTGALALALGERADSNAIGDLTKKCIAEATFQIAANKKIEKFFLKEDLDTDTSITLRREVASNGKSRSFINDTPVNLSQLKTLASLLIDMHQQFDTLDLGNDDFQREVVDALAAHPENIQQYQYSYKQLVTAQQTLQQLKDQQANSNKELDYHTFLYNELQEVSLKENELETIEQELQVLNNANHIKNILHTIFYALKESETPIAGQLKGMTQQLQNLYSNHDDIIAITQRLQSTQIELTDIADDVETILEKINDDPQRLATISERLDIGYKLLKKHQVQTTAELIAIQNNLATQLQQLTTLDATILEKEKLVEQLQVATTQMAVILRENRLKVTAELENKINALLKKVGMPNASVQIKIAPTALQLHGADAITFLLDANHNGRFEPLHKVASGGELSRLMLVIKSIVAKSVHLPTMLFDEIDSGISGEAAKQVGLLLKELAVSHQIISITHQPQIAARANAHLFVYKENKNNMIQTQIKELNESERIETIAGMLAGDNPSETVLQNAREMILQ